MNTPSTLTINLEQVIADKNPTLARWLPRFVIAYLKRIVHQDDINRILHSYAQLPPVEFIRASLQDLRIGYHAVGIERLDPHGRYLFAANHPFGGMDGLMLLDELDRYFASGRIIVNDLLMNVKPLAPLFVPINKHGRQNSTYARLMHEALEGPEQIATFPAGLCSRRHHGKVCDLDWKPSFIKNAIASHRAVVPVYFEGHLSNFFYNLANLRTTLGIKANIEMLYLVDELFKQQGSHFRIVFGDPIPWQEIAAHGSPRDWCLQVRQRVYALAPQDKA